MSGSLTIVGTGIRLLQQATLEAIGEIERADEVYFLVADPLMAAWLWKLRPDARSLTTSCKEGRPRREAYDEIADRILEPVREGKDVCVAFYGHPGFFVDPAHTAIRLAREEGLSAVLLPGISSEDCLYAELGVDPGKGCQSYESTDFITRRPTFDPTVSLVLLQISVVGVREFSQRPHQSGLEALAAMLLEHYPAEHEVVVYEAACYPALESKIAQVPLMALGEAKVPQAATLYVPPLGPERGSRALLREPLS